MNVLTDANILLRSAEPGHPQYPPARAATALLRAQGYTLCVVPQNFYEVWVVGTRPVTANGLGWTAAEATTELASIRSGFTLLDDTPAVLPEWERLVAAYGVLGKKAHDARLVAAMHVHAVTRLLTFNDQDFRRYRGITVWTPADVLASVPVSPAPPPPTP